MDGDFGQQLAHMAGVGAPIVDRPEPPDRISGFGEMVFGEDVV